MYCTHQTQIIYKHSHRLSTKLTYRIAGNFRGVKIHSFRVQADLDENFTYENLSLCGRALLI